MADICHDLNISDIFKDPTTQLAARRASSRSQRGVHVLNTPELEAEVLSSDKVDRQYLLSNIWHWYQIPGKARYVASLDSIVPWKLTCIGDQTRNLALDLSSLSSIWARAVVSARSGKLLAFRRRLRNQAFEFVNPSQYQCNDCDEHLEDARTGCVHYPVDCPVMWPKTDHYLEDV